MVTISQKRANWWAGLDAQDRRTYRHELWLRRSGQWHGGQFGIKWRPIKILGRGSYGVCGLFEYKGDEVQDEVPSHIVVKQTHAAIDEELRIESDFLAKLNRSSSSHVIKMYKSITTERGTGTHSRYDPLPVNTPANRVKRRTEERMKDGTRETIEYNSWKETAWPRVSRIYLEYCDLKSLSIYRLVNHGQAGVALPNAPPNVTPNELDAWRLWEDLAKALCVLELGESEDTYVSGWAPVIHFDLKGANVFVKTNPGAAFHEFKIADFGSARYWPGVDKEQDIRWIADCIWRGTIGFRPPESIRPKHPNRKFGMKVDIWSVAAIMHDFVTGTNFGLSRTQQMRELREIDCGVQRPGRLRNDPPSSGIILTQMGGFRNAAGNVNYGYSDKFRKLLFRCLAFDPDERPTAKEMLAEIQESIRIYQLNANHSSLGITLNVGAPVPGYGINYTQNIVAEDFHNVKDPQRQRIGHDKPPEPFGVKNIDFFGASKAEIRKNGRGGKRNIWDTAIHENLIPATDRDQTMLDVIQQELDAAADIAPVDYLAKFDRWLRFAVLYPARKMRFL